MTDHPHPLTETRAVELWNASLPATSWATAWILRPLGDRDRTHPLLAPLRTAYDAGREDALEAVLAMHTPKGNGRVTPCCSCEQWIESPNNEACIEYPCPTVEAITTALRMNGAHEETP